RLARARVRDMSSGAPELIAAEVEALLERNRIVQAKARLRGALQDHPSHPRMLLQSACADYISGSNMDALHSAHQVLLSDQENKSARQLLFAVLTEKNDLAEAERDGRYGGRPCCCRSYNPPKRTEGAALDGSDGLATHLSAALSPARCG